MLASLRGHCTLTGDLHTDVLSSSKAVGRLPIILFSHTTFEKPFFNIAFLCPSSDSSHVLVLNF